MTKINAMGVFLESARKDANEIVDIMPCRSKLMRIAGSEKKTASLILLFDATARANDINPMPQPIRLLPEESMKLIVPTNPKIALAIGKLIIKNMIKLIQSRYAPWYKLIPDTLSIGISLWMTLSLAIARKMTR